LRRWHLPGVSAKDCPPLCCPVQTRVAGTKSTKGTMHQTGRMVTKQVARTRGHGAIKEKITHPQRVSAFCVVAQTGRLLESQVRQVLVMRGLCGVVLVCVCVSIAGVARLLDRGIRLIISCSGWVLTESPRVEPFVVSCFVDLFQVRKRVRKSSSFKMRPTLATNCTTTRESHNGVSTCPGHVVQGQHVAQYRVQHTHRTVVQDQRFRRPKIYVCQRV